MVIAIGIATAVRLLVIPRPMKDHPSSLNTFLTVSARDKSVLNILYLIKYIKRLQCLKKLSTYSFRTTSTGFVRAAPAIPAVTDLIADRFTTSFLSCGSHFGKISSM